MFLLIISDEGELLEKVVVEVLERVKKPALLRDVGKYPTGLDEKAEDFEKFLLRQQQRGKHQILAIMGLGGIGKTTLATELFNRKTSYYSRSCFLSDVKDKKGNDLILLQKEILEILDVPDDKIKRVKDVAEGKVVIRNHLSSSKALVIIDDVDDEDQVDALLPHQSVIHPDSLILITSRNRDVLRNSNVEEDSIYTLSGLSERHSLELFCSHSFNQSYPPQEFESLVEKFVEACSGLPLSLKVIGALLKRKSKSYWEDLLNKLGRTLPSEIKQKLQISYNALEEEEKEIFLDIACFFIGEDRDRVIRILGESGFQNIVDRSLVDVDRKKRIKMHDHVRDMGRELAKGSGLPGRLWRWTEEDNGDLLRKSRNGQMTDVRGVRIHGGEYTQVDDGIRMSRLQFLDAKGDLMERILTKVSSSNLKWLRWTCNRILLPCEHYTLLRWVPMNNLRVLQIEGHRLKTLWEEQLEPPLQLRELEIKICSLSHIPNSIGQLKHLERIVICNVKPEKITITELPEEFCGLRSLKVLVLEGWSRMKALPKKFGNLTELQHLQLSKCSALKSLPESFGELTNLQHVDLSDCSNLARLPESFGELTNLQHIQLSSCTALDSLPESFGKLSNLQRIDLSYCRALERLSDSFGDLIKLQHLNLVGCSELSLPRETLGDISTLKYIDLSYCRKIEVLPSQVAHQRSLEQLRLRATNLKELPSAIGQLSCMEVLELGDAPLLDKLPFQLYDLKKLKELRIVGWQELKVLPDALCDLKNLKQLSISGCKKLKCLPPLLGDLSNLNTLKIFGCDELNRLPTSIGRLTQLTYLSVWGCPLIRELPLKEEVVRGKRGTLNDFQILPRLQELHVSETGISEVSFAERVCCNLQRLYIERCNNVVEVGKLPNTLIELSFRGCVKLKNIRGLGQLKKLEELDIEGCSDLEEVEGIQYCTSLRYIVPNCSWMRE
eukprot:PITA_14905